MHLTLLLALLTSSPAPLQQAERVTAWSEDALHLVAETERLHPNAYFGCPREEFEQAIDAYLVGLEQSSENQALVGLMRLQARLARSGRDGHSGLWPLAAQPLPLQLYGFDDGWFVVAASEPHGARVGARLVALGGVPVEEACARLAPLLTRDNDWNLRLKLAGALLVSELLDGVGLAEPSGEIRVTLEQAGAREELLLRGSAAGAHEFWGRPALPARAGVRWLTGREQAFRLEVLAEERALYVQYNEVAAADRAGRSLADFAEELARTFAERKLERVIIDLRSNGGGNNGTFGPLIAVLQRPEFARPGVVYGLIGRATFSAAGNFVTVLERDTSAILVGEPTGGAPNQYGDARNVTLPHHGALLVRVSTRYHQFSTPDDPRLTHEPQLAVPLRAADYFEGRDPVLAAALAHRPGK